MIVSAIKIVEALQQVPQKHVLGCPTFKNCHYCLIVLVETNNMIP